MYVLCIVYQLENISLEHDGCHHRDGRQYFRYCMPAEYFITAFHSNDIPTRHYIYYFHVK